jgi:23S rRNA (uracil1939-C5)-methyltransferase
MAVGGPVSEPLLAVTVRAIAAGGAGVADLPDGRVVFVPRTAPGDLASIHIERTKSRWASATLRAVIEPGPDRREPLCDLYAVCGGCQLQHLPYERQLEWKGRFVSDALTRIGGLTGIGAPAVEASPHETRYRNRVTFTLRRLRGGRVVAGFHALDRPTHVIDVAGQCVLPRSVLQEAWQSLRASWGLGARLLPAGGRLRLTLREDAGGVTLVVEGGDAAWSGTELAEAMPQLGAIWHRAGDGAKEASLVTGRPEAGATAFAQVNPEVAARLVAHVVASAGEGERAVDAYCGAGEYGRRLAESGWSVTGIERNPDACEAARRDATGDFDMLEGAVEDRLREALPADVLIVNPPRSGLASRVVDIVADSGVHRLVYVSCDPATLARDVRALAAGYAIESVRSFDLFPQTAHVETVLVLGRDSR